MHNQESGAVSREKGKRKKVNENLVQVEVQVKVKKSRLSFLDMRVRGSLIVPRSGTVECSPWRKPWDLNIENLTEPRSGGRAYPTA